MSTSRPWWIQAPVYIKNSAELIWNSGVSAADTEKLARWIAAYSRSR